MAQTGSDAKRYRMTVLDVVDVACDGSIICRTLPPLEAGRDYGCDPLPDGMFRMVPSGDVVTEDEKERRLRRSAS